MKETRYLVDPKQPYSLHDHRVNDIELENSNLILSFEDGFTKLAEPYSNVKGRITIEGVDEDFSDITIESSPNEKGIFQGEKLSVLNFKEKYKGFSFEVINEYYGWHRLILEGCLWLKDNNPKNISLSIGYFTGDIVYNTLE